MSSAVIKSWGGITRCSIGASNISCGNSFPLRIFPIKVFLELQIFSSACFNKLN